MIRASFRVACRALAGLLVMTAALLAAPRDAHAVYKFCANINPVYVDSNVGEDYLKGLVTAGFHYMVVTFNGVQTTGYADANGCLATTFSGAGTYTHSIYTRVRLGSSTTTVLEREGSTLRGLLATWSNLPASTGAGVTEKRTTITGTAQDFLFRVSAVIEFVPAPVTVTNATYTIYARSPESEAQCTACAGGNKVWLSNHTSNPSVWTNQSKAIIAHEFGHLSQSGIFGVFGQQNVSGTNKYCEHVDEFPCLCIWVADSPPSDFCGGEQIDRVHCLNSREYMFGAFGEGYAHLIATITLNNASEGAAIFPYYKNLVNSDGSSATAPPVAHQVLPSTRHRWMERQCAVAMSGKGTEMDWLGFLYWVNTQTTNKYSFPDIQKVMTHASVCNGVCTDDDKVSYAKMVQGVDGQTSWTAAKKNHFKDNGSVYGVNH